MKATIEQLQQMMRHDDLEFFYNDDKDVMLIPFDHRVGSFHVTLIVGDDHVYLYATNLQSVQATDRHAAAVFREMLSVSFKTDVARVFREDDTGDIGVYASAPTPEDSGDPDAFSGFIRAFAEDVKLVTGRLHDVVVTGKTSNEREAEAAIEKLFDDCCEQFAAENSATPDRPNSKAD